MWFPPPDLLQSHDGSSALLLLSWQELFDPYTPDTYQPRLTSVTTLVDELKAVAQRAIHDPRWNKHVDLLREELKATIATEEAFLAQLPFYSWAIQHLAGGVQSAREIDAAAATLIEQHAALNDHVCRQFEQSVAQLPKQKSAMSAALGRLATLTLEAQHAPSEMLALTTQAGLAFEPKVIGELFTGTVKRKNKTYECFISVRGPKSDLQAIVRETASRKTGFRLVNKDTRPKDATAEAFWKDQTPTVDDTSFVTSKVQGFSAAEAARIALRNLRPVVDVFNLYKNAQCLTIQDSVLVLDGSKSHQIDVSDSSLRRLKPRKNARRLTIDILDQISPERLGGRVLNALEHHALAHSSAATRVRFVSLWSALECLVGSPSLAGSSDNSIISAVCDSVAPIIAWRQVDKLVRYFAICLQEFRGSLSAGGSGDTGGLGEGFSREKENHIAPESVLLVLAKPKDHPHILSLLKYTAPHPLLCNRAYELWKIFQTPKNLRKELTSAFATVRWNLHRLYRARNLIVHQGEEAPLLEHQLEILHYYFSLTLSRILHDMRLHANWNVYDSTAHWRMRYNYLADRLNHSPNSLVLGDFLPEPIKMTNLSVWSG